jgi:hypothetical protein
LRKKRGEERKGIQLVLVVFFLFPPHPAVHSVPVTHHSDSSTSSLSPTYACSPLIFTELAPEVEVVFLRSAGSTTGMTNGAPPPPPEVVVVVVVVVEGRRSADCCGVVVFETDGRGTAFSLLLLLFAGGGGWKKPPTGATGRVEAAEAVVLVVELG